jgi:transcriptional regulator with XRE-family HTH domain
MYRCEINSHVGRRIRAERRRQELTQRELADACGVTFQVIHKYEAGLVTISAGMLWRVADALGISVTDLFPLPPSTEPKAHSSGFRRQLDASH